MLVSMVVFGLESAAQYILSFLPDSIFESMFVTAIFAIGAFISMILQSAINIIIQLFAILYTFELYRDYDKAPVTKK